MLPVLGIRDRYDRSGVIGKRMYGYVIALVNRYGKSQTRGRCTLDCGHLDEKDRSVVGYGDKHSICKR